MAFLKSTVLGLCKHSSIGSFSSASLSKCRLLCSVRGGNKRFFCYRTFLPKAFFLPNTLRGVPRLAKTDIATLFFRLTILSFMIFRRQKMKSQILSLLGFIIKNFCIFFFPFIKYFKEIKR